MFSCTDFYSDIFHYKLKTRKIRVPELFFLVSELTSTNQHNEVFLVGFDWLENNVLP